MVKQEDVADILNRVNEALRNTKYSAQGYDNTDTWLHIIIDEEEQENDKRANRSNKTRQNILFKSK